MSLGSAAEKPEKAASIYLLAQAALDRLAYRRLLEGELRCRVHVDSDFTPTAIWAALRATPDLVLAIADTPRVDVLDALDMIGRLQPGVRVLIMSAVVDPAQVEAWHRCFLHGYITKNSSPAALHNAIEALLHGRSYFSVGIQAALSRGAARGNGTLKLTPRESELLPLLARGLTLRDAAATMTISYKTADAHRTKLLRKIGVRDRVELARYAIRQRIIEP